MPNVDTSKLKGLMTQHGIHQYELAELLDIAFTTFNRKLNGKSPFTLLEAKILADFFDMTVEELFFSHDVTKLETKAS